MPIQVDNIEAFGEGLDSIFEALSSESVVEQFQTLGDEVAETARGYAPEYHGPAREGAYFEPGHLKDQINARAGRDLATQAPWLSVGAPWYVGGFMEYGTEHNRPQPFMQPTATEWESQVEGRLGEIVAGELD